jgi:hypothetical protein
MIRLLQVRNRVNAVSYNKHGIYDKCSPVVRSYEPQQ